MTIDPQQDIVVPVGRTHNGMATKTQNILSDVGQELKTNPPGVVQRTAAKFGPIRARKQRIAILLSKARKQGAMIPQKGMTG